MSIDRWMDKKNEIYKYNEKLFIPQKEGNSVVLFQFSMQDLLARRILTLNDS